MAFFRYAEQNLRRESLQVQHAIKGSREKVEDVNRNLPSHAAARGRAGAGQEAKPFKCRACTCLAGPLSQRTDTGETAQVAD